MTKKILFLTLIVLFTFSLTGCFDKTTTEDSSIAKEDEGGAADTSDEEETLYDIVTKNWDIENLSYTEKTATSEQTMESKVYMKNGNMRWESYSDGKMVVLIMNDDQGTFYTYYPDENTAIKMDMSEMSDDELPKNPVDMTDEIDSGCANKGKESIDDMKCTRVECSYEDGQGQINSKMWIWDKYGIVVKAEYLDASGKTTTTKIEDISFDKIDDSKFELPDDVELVNLMDGLNGLLESLQGLGNLDY